MNIRRKRLDPRLRKLVTQKEVRAPSLPEVNCRCFTAQKEDVEGLREKKTVPADRIQAYALVRARDAGDPNELRKLGVTRMVRLANGIWSIHFHVNACRELAASAVVDYVEAARPVSAMLTSSVGAVHARPEDVGEAVTGEGVVIGVVDYGIDWSLPDFCNDNGNRTRIKYLWDQSLDAEDGENEHAPDPFCYGVEYDEERINEALAAFRNGSREDALARVRHRPWPAEEELLTDVAGHGTHVAGIATGNGESVSQSCTRCPPGRGKYRGVAPKAWIVFVHMDRPRVERQIRRRRETLVDSAQLAEAVAYCFWKADDISAELGRPIPCVVNLSMGFNGGSHDGESLVERVIDSLLEEKIGRALVVASGNEHRRRSHASGRVGAGEKFQLTWMMGRGTVNNGKEDPTLNEMEIWYSSRDKFRVRLIDGDGHPGDEIEPDHEKEYDASGNTRVFIDSERFTPLNGDARIFIQVAPNDQSIPASDWVVELECDNPVDGTFDAWIEKETGIGVRGSVDPRQSRFLSRQAGHDTTLTTPATGHQVIAVGGIIHEGTPRVWEDSGGGPTRDDRCKPDVVAPSVKICSNNVTLDRTPSPECSHIQMSGTSLAAPHVTGIVALMMQLRPDLTAEQIRKILIASAESSSRESNFDPGWGFGIVNARKALEFARQVDTS